MTLFGIGRKQGQYEQHALASPEVPHKDRWARAFTKARATGSFEAAKAIADAEVGPLEIIPWD